MKLSSVNPEMKKTPGFPFHKRRELKPEREGSLHFVHKGR